MIIRPLLKWTGGKSDELPFIMPKVPPLTRYMEPFAGGAAVLWNMPPGTQSVVGDMSEDLISLYNFCKNCPEKFISRLNFLDKLWNNPLPKSVIPMLKENAPNGMPDDYETALEAFYRKFRRTGNETITETEAEITSRKKALYHLLRLAFNFSEPASSDRAALFWMMRELAYNGMFRHNAAGHFNVPYGGRTYDCRIPGDKFGKIHTEPYRTVLNSATFIRADFSVIMNSSRDGDFIFLDPPYDSPFSTYDRNAFTVSDHERLGGILHGLLSGVKWMIVIAHTPRTERIYAGIPGTHRIDFSKRYRTNIRNRFAQDALHMCITNY